MSSQENLNRVAIVGAGPAGLSVARALKVVGIPFTIYEKHSDVGGIWDKDNQGSPVYRSAHFISSKTMSGHIGHPMPQHYPDYPSNQQVLAYIKSFATSEELLPAIRFNTVVEEAKRERDYWLVTSKTLGASGENEPKHERYRWLVCASGTNWFPNRPAIKGEESFAGEIIHSVEYNDSDILRDKRVLIVGAGNSGVDIACDAAYASKKALISLRRGYHFIPKNIFGIPSDVFGAQSKWMPFWLRQRIFGVLLRLLNGDLSRLGLPRPDHRVFESHPILNTQVLHYLQHGDLSVRPDIDYAEGDKVYFNDGSCEEVDLIILATGYRWHIPYLNCPSLDWVNDRPRTSRKMFIPSEPTLFLNGYIELAGGAYKLFDEMAMLLAMSISKQAQGGSDLLALNRYLEKDEPNLGGNTSYVNSARHTNYTDVDKFNKMMRDMRKTLGWATPEVFYSK